MLYTRGMWIAERLLGWLHLLNTGAFSPRVKRYDAHHSSYRCLGYVRNGVPIELLLFANQNGELVSLDDLPHIEIAQAAVRQETTSKIQREMYINFTKSTFDLGRRKFENLTRVNPLSFQILVSPIFRKKKEGLRFVVIDGCHRSAMACATGQKRLRARVICPVLARI